MAIVKRTSAGKAVTSTSQKTARPSADSGDLSHLRLSTELSKPVTRIEDINWVIYGDGGIGKTSLASQFKGAYFLLFEPGGKGLELSKSEIYDWRHYLKYVDLLCQAPQWKTIIFDVTDDMYERCYEFVCKRDHMTHPNDKGWGEGWKAIRKEFEKPIRKLAAANKSLVFLSHAKDRTFQSRSGRQYNKIVPSMSASAWDFIGGYVDITAFYGYFGEDRYLTVRGSDELEAKQRIKRRFRTKDGKRVHSIPMFSRDANKDFDEEDAYKNLIRAFDNLQVRTGEPEDAATLGNIAAKPKAR